MGKLQKEMDSLKGEIIAEKRVELNKTEGQKEESNDYDIEKSQLDAFASKLASMAEYSSDKAMTHMIEDSSLIQLRDESLANVEIDSGDATAEQALGAAGALDDNQNAVLEQAV